MEYPKEFISLIHRLDKQPNPNLCFIGQGSPRAKMIIVERDNHIDTSTTRGKGCYMMEVLHNANQWMRNIEGNICANDIPSWVESPFSSGNFNPLYPYKGLKRVLAKRDTDGSTINNGVSKSWLSYQKLRRIISPAFESEEIDFHQGAFLTSLSSVNCPIHGYSDEVRKSIGDRCEQLFTDSYFRSFDVILMPCGKMVKDCHVNVEKVFDQKFIEEIKYGDEWVRYYEKGGRVLMLTSPVIKCSDSLLNVIGNKARETLLKPLLKYFVYYKGTEDSMSKNLMAGYEHSWACSHLIGEDVRFEHEVYDMIKYYEIEEEWIDSFGIPRTLIGLFFNRYCHWSYYTTKDNFKHWFEDVRNVKNK